MDGEVMRWLAPVLVVLTLVSSPLTAHSTETPAPSPTVQPNQDGPGGFGTSGTSEVEGNQGDDGASVDEATGNDQVVPASTVSSIIWKLGDLSCDTYSGSGCVTPNRCSDGSIPQTWTMLDAATGEPLGTYDQCPEDPPPSEDTTPTTPVDIPGEVLKAFKRVDLPKSTINVQPPGGETLVNLPTILSTSAERHQIPVRLEAVNLDITLEVWPSSFVWHHGDDTSQETTTPGNAWTEGANLADLVTHTYAKTSEGLDLSVDTTWSAQFKVAGQPNWRPVNGTVSITGDPVTVAVLEAKPQLVR